MSERGLSRSGLLVAAVAIAAILAACGSPAPHAASPAASSVQGAGKAKITLSPARPAGPGDLAAAAAVIRRRAAALELPGLQVTVSGAGLVLTGPRPSQEELATLIAGGLLRLRPVLLSAPYAGPSAPASRGPGMTGPPYGDARKVNAATTRLLGKLACEPDPHASTVNDNWKATVGYTPAQASWEDPGIQVVSCDASGTRYVLDKAVFEGNDVTSASSSFLPAAAQWVIILKLNGKATAAFAAQPASQYNSYFADASTNPDDAALDSIAVVLDGNVLSAPQIQQPITAGQVQISGGAAGFTRAAADRLAALLQGGALPEGFQVTAIDAPAPATAH